MNNKTLERGKLIKLSDDVICYSRCTSELSQRVASSLFDKTCQLYNKKIVSKYNENVLSGRGLKRPLLNKLLKDNNNYDIIINSFSAISRDETEFKDIAKKCEENGKKIYSINDDMYINEMTLELENKYKRKGKDMSM